jgi:hypothetical protein
MVYTGLKLPTLLAQGARMPSVRAVPILLLRFEKLVSHFLPENESKTACLLEHLIAVAIETGTTKASSVEERIGSTKKRIAQDN